MPRKPKPWWWKARQRWAVQVGGVRHVEPDGIAEDDLSGMAAWWESLRDSLPTKATRTGGLTVGQLCEAYIEWDAQRVAAGLRDADSHKKIRNRLKLICREAIKGGKVGKWRARRFRPKQYDELVMIWQAKRSRGYTRALASTLKTAFNWATREISGPLLRTNPIAGASKPPEPIIEDRFAEPEEAAAWLEWLKKKNVHPDYTLLQEVLIYTGARPSEWTRATIRELDTREWILVRDRWKNADKVRKSRRVFVPTRLREALTAHIRDARPDRLIFLTPTGKPWNPSRLSSTTTRYRARAIADGVKIRDDGADRLTCYRWRHTAITALLMDGVPINTVAELTGTSAVQISKTYAHLVNSHLANAAEILGKR